MALNRKLSSTSAINLQLLTLKEPLEQLDKQDMNIYHKMTFEKQIGHGSYGNVFKGTYDGKQVAIKKIAYAKNEFSQFLHEVKVMQQLEESNRIVNIITWCTKTDRRGSFLYIAMGYEEAGSLDQVIDKNQPLKWDIRARILSDVAEGLMHMHSKKIIHRDLKSANILLTGEQRAKISDFGLAKEIDNQVASVGTEDYRAPEVGILPYTEKSDIHSFGVVAFETSVWKAPCISHQDTINGKRPSIPTEIPTSISNLIKLSWMHDPNMRPTAQEILDKHLNEENIQAVKLIN